MSEFQCQVEVPAVSGLPDGEITVGRKYVITCEGPFPRDIEPEKVQLKLPPDNKYDLKLFSFEFRSLSTVDLSVTSYRASTGELPLILQYGDKELNLGIIKHTVKSVLPPQDPQAQQQPEQQQPYPSMGPATLPVPPLYWALLLGVIACLGTYVYFKVLRHVQRKNMIESLKEYDNALTPVNQFYHNLRRLQRENSAFAGVKASPEDIATAIRALVWMWQLYLTREFKIPADKWNDSLVLKNLKKYNRNIYSEFAPDFKKIFKEVKNFQVEGTKFDETDVQNFAKQARFLIEKVERFK